MLIYSHFITCLFSQCTLSLSWPIYQNMQQILLQSTQREFFKVNPTPRYFMIADRHSLWLSAQSRDQLNCPRGKHMADYRLFGWQDICISALATKTQIVFIWEQIMQQNGPLSFDIQITMYVSVKWRGISLDLKTL